MKHLSVIFFIWRPTCIHNWVLITVILLSISWLTVNTQSINIPLQNLKPLIWILLFMRCCVISHWVGNHIFSSWQRVGIPQRIDFGPALVPRPPLMPGWLLQVPRSFRQSWITPIACCWAAVEGVRSWFSGWVRGRLYRVGRWLESVSSELSGCTAVFSAAGYPFWTGLILFFDVSRFYFCYMSTKYDSK